MDDSGQPVAVSRAVHVISKGVAADEFYVLDCDRLIGIDLRPSEANWPVQFPKGKYRVSIHAELTNRSFAESRPGLIEKISKRVRQPVKVVRAMLVEQTVVAPEVTFEVLQ